MNLHNHDRRARTRDAQLQTIMSHPSRPVVSNPNTGAGMAPETEYGDR